MPSLSTYDSINSGASTPRDTTGTTVGTKRGLDVNIIGGSGGGGGTTYPTDDILKATDKQESYTWLDWNSRKLRRVSVIVYTAASVSPTASITDTFNYTLSAGEYKLDSITRVYTS